MNKFPHCYIVAIQKRRWDESSDGTCDHEGHNRVTDALHNRNVELACFSEAKPWATGDVVEVEGVDFRPNWDGHSRWRATGVVIGYIQAPTLIGYELPDPTPFPDLEKGCGVCGNYLTPFEDEMCDHCKMSEI